MRLESGESRVNIKIARVAAAAARDVPAAVGERIGGAKTRSNSSDGHVTGELRPLNV